MKIVVGGTLFETWTVSFAFRDSIALPIQGPGWYLNTGFLSFPALSFTIALCGFILMVSYLIIWLLMKIYFWQ
jgi:hypothetical protein